MRSTVKRASRRDPRRSLPFPAGVSPTDILGHVLKLYNRLLVPFSAHLEKRHKIGLNEFRMLMMIGQSRHHGLPRSGGAHRRQHHGHQPRRGAAAQASAHRGHDRPEQSPPQRRCGSRRPAARCTSRCCPPREKVARYLFEALRPDEIMAFDRFVENGDRQAGSDGRGRQVPVPRSAPRPDARNRHDERPLFDAWTTRASSSRWRSGWHFRACR